jgi:protein-disulfide isomerase
MKSARNAFGSMTLLGTILMIATWGWPRARANTVAAVPTKDEIEASMKRSFGYDPSVSWVVYDIRPSTIPNLADVLVSLNKGKPIDIYVSTETQSAIVGQMMPFGPNPFAAVRAALDGVDGPALGSKTPTILMVLFTDLECPHCKAAEPILEKLVTDFPQVRLVFLQFPLPATMHPWALKAAQYADCAGRIEPKAFWNYADSVFQNQTDITAQNADEKLKDLATGAGLDAQRISACAISPDTHDRVAKTVERGQSLDVTQTPTVFLNGRMVLGIADIPYAQLKNLVQFEIDHAGK